MDLPTAGGALFLQRFRTERHKAKQRIIITAKEPDPLVQRWAHAPAAGPAVAAVAARLSELTVTFFSDFCEVLVGTFELSFGRVLDQFGSMVSPALQQNLQARWPMPTYFAARLITQDWAQPIDRWHEIYAANSDMKDGSGHQIVTAYAVKRPDQRWAIMLLNKDSEHAYAVHIRFTDGQSCGQSFGRRVQVFQYSPEQYTWKRSGEDGHPIRTNSPHHFAVAGNSAVRLPPLSLTVVRGMAPGQSQIPSPARQPAVKTPVQTASR